jgi:hypothetical protein
MKVQIEKINDPGMMEAICRGFPKGDKKIMLDCYKASYSIWMGLVDNKMACIWGVTLASLLSNRAYIWLWTSDLVKGFPFVFVRRAQIEIRELLKEHDEVYGVVNSHLPGTTNSIRWLKLLGAKFGSPKENGLIPFWIRKAQDG